jgi:hypothetical protein
MTTHQLENQASVYLAIATCVSCNIVMQFYKGYTMHTKHRIQLYTFLQISLNLHFHLIRPRCDAASSFILRSRESAG